MPCYCPLDAYYSKDVGKSGKRGITFDRNASFSGVKLKLPCGQCIGCRLEHSRQWAVRAMHEKQMHEVSSFLTLTYDDKHLPEGGSLVKRHVQLFMKRLRKWYWAKYKQRIRFYGCGEYGETTGRPHYHIILFGAVFSDKKFYKKTRAGFNLYTSDMVSKLWTYGYNVIGDVDFDSCAYVARYVTGKITGELADSHYVDKATGIVKEREFPLASRRPGIGLKWFEKYGKQAYNFDSVIMNGVEVKPPKYYDNKFELTDPEMLARIKKERRRDAVKRVKDNRVDRLRVREAVVQAKMKLKGKEL